MKLNSLVATMATSPIRLYAELLSNIRQVSVSVTLENPIDDTSSTVAEVLRDGVTLRVRHAGAVQDLTLPCQVAAAGTMLSLGKAQSNYAAWRLPLSAGVHTSRGPTDSGQAPWSAPDLRPGAAVACRGCGAVIVAKGRVYTWKDLPSDNWAEMMEFWHCHKPDHDHASNGGIATSTGLADRGYGANSVISAEPGIGFVDLISLLFSKCDCQDVLVCCRPLSA